MQDTSLHLTLPHKRVTELIELGWAELHQHGDYGTEVMIYAPRDDDELHITVSIVGESLRFATTAP